jgi:spore maturation protein B
MTVVSALGGFADWVIPAVVVGVPAFAYVKKVKVYETFVDGAKDGFQSAVALIPHLVGMLVAISVFRVSGALDLVVHALGNLTDPLGIPRDVVPLGLLRPLTGTGSFAYATDLMKTHGVDSLAGLIAATIQSSSDTTLYVLTVYFGAIGIERTRYALQVGLLSDFVGFLASVFFCLWLFH